MKWYGFYRSRPLTKTLTGTNFKAHPSLATLIQFQTHISRFTFTSGGHGVVRPRTSPAPNTTQRLQTCSAYLRQNSLWPKREWTSTSTRECFEPGPSHQLLCPEKGVFVWAQKPGWLGHRHLPAGCASRPWHDGNSSLLLHKCETLFSSFTTTVYPAPLCWGATAHTHAALYYYTYEDFPLSVIPHFNQNT